MEEIAKAIQALDLNLEANHRRQLQVELSAETWTWMVSLSSSLMAVEGAHGAGHAEGTVSQSTGALVLGTVIILTLSTLYFMWRVYYKKKYFTPSWVKSYGEPNPVSWMESPSKNREDSDVNAHTTSMELQGRQQKPGQLGKESVRGLGINKQQSSEPRKQVPQSVDPVDIQVEFDDDEDHGDNDDDDDQADLPDEDSESEEEDEEEEDPQNNKAAQPSQLNKKQQQLEQLEKEERQKKTNDSKGTPYNPNLDRSKKSMKSNKTDQDQEYYDEEEEEDEHLEEEQ